MSALDNVHGPVPYIDAAAVVAGRPAAEIGAVLLAAFEAGGFDHLHGAERDMVLRTVKAVVVAGDRWRFRSGSDVGNSETPRPRFGGRSAHESMSVDEAAAMLKVGTRRVRQLAPALGVQVGGVWVLDRDLVEAELERRCAS